MNKYPIKIQNTDFKILENLTNSKGSRVKKLAVDTNDEKAFFKYEGKGYLVSESCSEKMSYEIAKVLGYDCAKIELAKDSEGNLGILNYLFIEIGDTEHIDIAQYINIHENERSELYTLSNIKSCLDKLDENLFESFIKIMVFDALVGEQDRHEENWGIQKIREKYKMSPLYDNGDNLLRYFRNDEYANKYYSGQKDFEAYIRNSKTAIYKENKKTYKHFELIEYLNKNYYNIVQKELKNLEKLTDKKIENIITRVPDELLTDIHKKYIIKYLKRRRDILLDKIGVR